jgi:hypothetical protein
MLVFYVCNDSSLFFHSCPDLIFSISVNNAQTRIHAYTHYSNYFDLRKIQVMQGLQEHNDCVRQRASVLGVIKSTVS